MREANERNADYLVFASLVLHDVEAEIVLQLIDTSSERILDTLDAAVKDMGDGDAIRFAADGLAQEIHRLLPRGRAQTIGSNALDAGTEQGYRPGVEAYVGVGPEATVDFHPLARIRIESARAESSQFRVIEKLGEEALTEGMTVVAR